MARRLRLRRERLHAAARAAQLPRRGLHWERLLLVTAATFLILYGFYVIVARPAVAAEVMEPCLAPQGTALPVHDRRHRLVGTACIVGHWDGRTYLLTAHHVIEGFAGAVESNLGQLRREAVSPESDLAIVSVPVIFGTAFSLGAPPQVGDEVVARGYFMGVRLQTHGRVANAELNWIDCATGPGMSGGPVVNSAGELVGLVAATWMPTDIGIMVSIHDIRDLIEEAMP